MKRLKGPELKLSELKVPPFLADLYWDLRERRLLPLVALVAVAIVAVPFLLGGGSEESPAPAPAPPPVAVISGATGTDASHLTVVQAKPGLRDYRKRLAGRQPTDPFEQRFTAPQVEGAELGGELESTASSTSTTTSTSTTEVTETTNSSNDTTITTETTDESKGGGASPDSQLTLFAFAIDVKITRIKDGGNGSKSKADSIRHGVMPTTPLPGEKAPVVTYMGVGKGAKKALLMVSNNVKSIFGDAKCLSGTDTCQLLEVEPGLPETFEYGDNGVHYKINVLDIEAVPAGDTRSSQE